MKHLAVLALPLLALSGPADAPGPAVLVEPGEGELELLQLATQVGERFVLTLDAGQSVGLVGDEEPIEDTDKIEKFRVPGSRIFFSLTVSSVDEETGTISLESEAISMGVLPTEGYELSDLAEIAETDGQYLKEVTLQFALGMSGVVKELDFQSDSELDAVQETQLDGWATYLRLCLPVFAEEKVGVGASWTHEREVAPTRIKGMEAATYVLNEAKDGEFELSYETSLDAPKQTVRWPGRTKNVCNLFKRSSKGTARWKRGNLFPNQSEVEARLHRIGGIAMMQMQTVNDFSLVLRSEQLEGSFEDWLAAQSALKPEASK